MGQFQKTPLGQAQFFGFDHIVDIGTLINNALPNSVAISGSSTGLAPAGLEVRSPFVGDVPVIFPAN